MKLRIFLLAGLLAATCAQAGNVAKVYYNTSYKGWSTVHMHFKPQGGVWTNLPGPVLGDACPNWKVGIIDIGSATQWEAAFNDGQGRWDNLNGVSGRNYQFGTGISLVVNGISIPNAGNPCPITDTQRPTVPEDVNATNLTATSVTIGWEPSTDDVDVTGYDVFRNGVRVGTVSGTSYNDTGLAPNTVYTYTVQAKDGSGKVSDPSLPLPVKTPNAVTATIHYKRTDGNYSNWCLHLWGTGLASGVGTSWTAPRCFEGSDGYGKYTTFTLSDASAKVGFIVHQGNTKDVTADRFFTPSVNKEIWIKQGDPTIYTSDPGGSLNPPTLDSPALVDGCKITLKWSAPSNTSGITGYEIARNDASIGTVAAGVLSYSDVGLNGDTVYSYKIRTKSGSQTSDWSNVVSAKTGSCAVPVLPPVLQSPALIDGCKVTIKWTAPANVTGITGYDIARNDVTVGSVTGSILSYSDTALNADTAYSYKVRTKVGDKISEWSNIVPAKTGSCAATVKPPVVESPALLEGCKVTLKWAAPANTTGITGYEIARNDVEVGSVGASALRFVDPALAANTSYNYKVRTLVGDTASDWSNVVPVKTGSCSATVNPPVLQTPPTVELCNVTIKWTAPVNTTGITGYDIARNDTAIASVGEGASSYLDANLAANTSFTYKVRTKAGTLTSNWSDAVVAKTGNCSVPQINPPVLQSPAEVDRCSINLKWAAPSNTSGITGYEIARNDSPIANVGASPLSYADTGLSENTTYSYKVRTKVGSETSIWSNSVSAKTGVCNVPEQPFRLGVVYTPQKSTFSIWSPDSSNVRLNLAGQSYTLNKIADRDGYSNVYSIEVPGDHHLKTYNFLVNGTSVRDPYGVMVEPGTNNNIVVDLSRTTLPSGWAARPPLKQREDAVIYEVHVRDFTIDASSGVSADKRGKYLGMVQAGTTVNGQAGAAKTGIDHLVDLGVTHVQILPVYDFGTCGPTSGPLCYNWGYDPVNYNVPEERYSATPNDPVNRIKEFKTMVDEFHKRGIRVVVDVVYNHTYKNEMFAGITPKYFTPTDLSGTGNSIDVKNPMVARMIRDSLEYWVKEFNVDGFRFDLLGIFDYSVVGDWGRYLNEQFPDRNLLLYGEPWNGYATDPYEKDRVRYGTIAAITDAHVGVFNGAYREALKGSNDSAEGGFMFNQGKIWGTNSVWPGTSLGLGPISAGVSASGRYTAGNTPLPNLWDSMFTMDPEQSINYVDAHDNLCLNDKVELWANANGQGGNTSYKRRIQEYAMSMVLTSQGIPFLHGGSEMLRTKHGDKNSYQSPDTTNAYDWNWRSNNASTYEFVKKVIQMRRSHSGFRMNTWEEVRSHVKSDQRNAGLVVTEINAAANEDSWSKALVIYNSGGNAVISLPSGNWKVALEKSSASAGSDRTVSGTIEAEGTAVTVLYQ